MQFVEKKDFIHAPPKNISDEKLTEKFKDKILLMKEKRELDKKFKKYKKLYDVDNPEIIDDVSAWVTRSRTLQSKDFTEPLLTKINNEDVSLTVEHDQREFGVGEEAILTLKDTG
ncbi:hypothetical protein HZS_5397 [Henneguya salminicola]|nr:hypothetical protein HZS_5397 [Henneguya salminicola]